MLIEKALPTLVKTYEAVEHAVVWEQTPVNNGLSDGSATFTSGGFAEKTGELIKSWSAVTFLYEIFEILHQSTPF
ncbi:hypothetical protein [Agrobacterium tumefaciens]|uniref:hypothetical protein n=1 Tax=Agrobacterium tumefaciens TaxID=358 RepID=UPI001FFCDE6F|nr:hypothetical protein [Agrobacterium tumefaciens]